MKKGTRLDAFLAESLLSQSREKAKREIIAGWVRVDGETVREPSRPVTGNENITVERPGGLYVSRGGQKLHHALDHFGIDVAGRTAADLGASTGGFTDCLLKRGASFVYAVDVGYGQLDFSLRTDPRVLAVERTNVRALRREDFERTVDLLTMDLSFISVLKTVEALHRVFAPVEGLFLIKPQFEAAKGEHKKGVVKDPAAHSAIVLRVLESLEALNVRVRGLCASPIKGPAGNIEFFARVFVGQPADDIAKSTVSAEAVDEVVKKAHAELK
ncbi:MAG TPA: TlyA family RNA methyltransferase [Spirochaetes bacterium]|nr:TlyA family RNA methyltransferase [Spirochaetota bacterium]